jgi:23S rRNA (pseudouridine1915-N3)-methyltransferase
VRYFVVAVGKSRPPFQDDLQHYSKLLSRYARVDVIEVADDEALQRRIPERAWVCLLDSRGRSYSSEAFAGWLEERRQAGPGRPARAALPRPQDPGGGAVPSLTCTPSTS